MLSLMHWLYNSSVVLIYVKYEIFERIFIKDSLSFVLISAMECQPSPPPPYHSLAANSLDTSKYATFSSPSQCTGMIPQCTLFSHDFPASLCLQSPNLDQRLGNSVGCVFRCRFVRFIFWFCRGIIVCCVRVWFVVYCFKAFYNWCRSHKGCVHSVCCLNAMSCVLPVD